MSKMPSVTVSYLKTRQQSSLLPKDAHSRILTPCGDYARRCTASNVLHCIGFRRFRPFFIQLDLKANPTAHASSLEELSQTNHHFMWDFTLTTLSILVHQMLLNFSFKNFSIRNTQFPTMIALNGSLVLNSLGMKQSQPSSVILIKRHSFLTWQTVINCQIVTNQLEPLLLGVALLSIVFHLPVLTMQHNFLLLRIFSR